ncbi:hypothetical protein BG55_17500 [Erwinia mallotivora]|uniref:Uncharacterized protein n=2 Tax=Erwinia mallotivora TaxID=69222 RepID=A0A014M8A8_9GAMM|nr:hypothetical protein BG55_17500 [Erwinia mallotivora]
MQDGMLQRMPELSFLPRLRRHKSGIFCHRLWRIAASDFDTAFNQSGQCSVNSAEQSEMEMLAGR